MAVPQARGHDRDYDRGFRDGRMDALLPRPGVGAPQDASPSYRDGYEAGAASVSQRVHKAA
jgi:hypothetical protein